MIYGLLFNDMLIDRQFNPSLITRYINDTLPPAFIIFYIDKGKMEMRKVSARREDLVPITEENYHEYLEYMI